MFIVVNFPNELAEVVITEKVLPPTRKCHEYRMKPEHCVQQRELPRQAPGMKNPVRKKEKTAL